MLGRDIDMEGRDIDMPFWAVAAVGAAVVAAIAMMAASRTIFFKAAFSLW